MFCILYFRAAKPGCSERLHGLFKCVREMSCKIVVPESEVVLMIVGERFK